MSLRVEVVVVTPFQQNCSVIWCSETLQGAVVDPGGDIDRVIAKIEQHKMVYNSLKGRMGNELHALAIKTKES